MRNYFFFSLLVILVNCDSRKSLTYEEGLKNCDEALHRKKEDSSLDRKIPDCLYGSKIPDFNSLTIDDKSITSEMLMGKVSIINFWFITCPPCVAEIPGFNAIVDKYGKDKVNFIGIGKDTKKDIQEFLIEHPWKFDLVHEGDEIIDDTFKLKWGFPTTFVLNKNGEIISAFSGGRTDELAIKEIQDKLISIIERELAK